MAEIDLITQILGQLNQTITRVEEKVDRQTERMDVLVDTTNHRLDDFRSAFIEHKVTVEHAIAEKADKTDLFTSVVFRLFENKVVRWGTGVFFAALVGTATFQHWWGVLAEFVARGF